MGSALLTSKCSLISLGKFNSDGASREGSSDRLRAGGGEDSPTPRK